MPEYPEDIYAGQEDIDFSDLEKQYEVNPDVGIENFVVIDGAPVIPEKKLEALTRVLKKLFGSVGKIVENGFHMPVDDSGNTKGYAFIEYESPEQAAEAVQAYNHKKLDQKHTLLVNKLSDVERYGFAGNVETEYKEPEIKPFQPREHLKWWLTDSQGRDQYLVQRAKDVDVFWHKKNGPSEPAAPAPIHTQTFSRWSPKGTYLVTFHLEGVQLRGGPSWKVLGQFPHMKPEAVDFSPNEKYIVTVSKDPIKLPPADSEARDRCPFKEADEGNYVIVWDIRTSLPLRTFPLGANPAKRPPWPMFKWSPDDKYFGRVVPGEAISIYSTPSMGLIDKKSIKVPGVVDFEWCPAPVQLAGKAGGEPSYLICFWTPEMNNQSARVSIMDIPSRQVVRSRNMFSVAGCRMHWQDEGKYLCVKVDRHTKTKKSTYTNLEFFRLTEKDIPVEVVDLKETVINFAWEPKSDRCIAISRPEVVMTPAALAGGAAPAPTHHSITFYGLESGKGNIAKWTMLKTVEKKGTNSLFWSPRGRFVITGNVGGSGAVELDFYDMDHDDGNRTKEAPTVIQHLGTVEHYGMTDLQWDPSGRFVASFSSVWRHRIENGYKIWDFRGSLLTEEGADQFGSFAWRPRPERALTKEQRKKVNKEMKKYSRRFDEEDAMEASEASRDLILRRRKALSDWTEWRQAMQETLSSLGLKSEADLVEEAKNMEGVEIIEEINEEILEEKEEVVG